MTFNIQDSHAHLADNVKQPTWWQRRTRFEKRMVMGIGIITVACLAFIIALIVLATKAHSENEFLNLIMSSIKRMNSDSSEQHSMKLCTTPGCLNAASQVLQSMDVEVNPCEDFYRYSCGNWIETHKIPNDKAEVDLFAQTTDQVMMQLRNEIEYPKKPNEGHAIHMAKDMYAACMNVATADSLGLPAFKEWVKELGGWPIATENWDSSKFDWQKMIIHFMKEGSEYLLSAIPDVDLKNNTKNILFIGIADTVLQSEYLLKQYEYPEIMNAYRIQIRMVAKLISSSANIEINETDINEIIQFETMLANVTNEALLEVDTNNLDNLYNKMTVQEVTEMSNGKFDWLRFLNDLYSEVRVISKDEEVIVSLPTTLPQFFEDFKKFDNRTVANYLLWRYTLKYIWHINNETRLAWFQFQKVISGEEIQPARWLACISIMNEILGEIMGSIYARYIIPKDTKSQAEEMIADLRKMVEIILDRNDWMDKITLRKAKIKAAAMVQFVAYPDWSFNDTYLDEMYQDLTALPVDIENYRQIEKFGGQYGLETLNETVDPDEWYTSASTVNAFYVASKNALIFPAGILQPPFFSPTNLKAMNYGAIGSVIGHEITHGFDSEGRQNDEKGNLINWWTNSSDKAYAVKTTCMRKQYGAYCNQMLKAELNLTKIPCVDANNTLCENIADNGGMKVALQAYKARILKDGPEPKLPGLTQFTAEQLFFISFAQVWCKSSRLQNEFETLLYDVHSPARFRVQGVLSNFDDFAQAFQCPPNSTMNPTNKCSFW